LKLLEFAAKIHIIIERTMLFWVKTMFLFKDMTKVTNDSVILPATLCMIMFCSPAVSVSDIAQYLVERRHRQGEAD
jgi:hypothetical protein